MHSNLAPAADRPLALVQDDDPRWRRLRGWLGRRGGTAAAQHLAGDGFHDLREILWQIVRMQGRRALGYHLCCTLPRGEFPVRGRPWVLGLALLQIVRHAARCCPYGGLLHIEALRSDEEVLVAVRVAAATPCSMEDESLQLARALLSAHGGALHVQGDAGDGDRSWVAALPRPRPVPVPRALVS